MQEEKDQYGHPRIPHRGHYELDKCNQRRLWAEKFTSSSLETVGEWWSREGKHQPHPQPTPLQNLVVDVCEFIQEFM